MRGAEPPTTETELRPFLRLRNLYKRFIKNFAITSHLLNELLKNGAPENFDLNENQHASFQRSSKLSVLHRPSPCLNQNCIIQLITTRHSTTYVARYSKPTTTLSVNRSDIVHGYSNRPRRTVQSPNLNELVFSRPSSPFAPTFNSKRSFSILINTHLNCNLTSPSLLPVSRYGPSDWQNSLSKSVTRRERTTTMQMPYPDSSQRPELLKITKTKFHIFILEELKITANSPSATSPQP